MDPTLNPMCPLLHVILLALIGYGHTSPTHIEKMTVSKMRMADLETSASGYSYNQQQGLPVSYVQYTNHGSNLYYDAPNPLHFVSSPQGPLSPPLRQPHAPGLVYASLGLPYAPPGPHPPLQVTRYAPVGPEVKAVAPYYSPDKEVGENKNFEVYEDYRESSDDLEGEEGELGHEPHVGLYHRSGGLIGNHIPGTLGRYGDAEGGYEVESGEDYKAEKHDEHGAEGGEGYEGYHGFDHGEKGEHSSDDHKGHYDEEDGHEKAHNENDAHYEQHEEGEKGENGSSFSRSSYHKKGHKTTGFHNVYRKDEYKKDTDFYDEDHNSGHFEKHSADDEHHEGAQGAFEKGDHRDSGYEHSDRAKAGLIDRGHDYNDHQGHKSEKGGDLYHNQHSKYGNKGVAKFFKEHGYGHGH